jgi:hypothetical protein
MSTYKASKFGITSNDVKIYFSIKNASHGCRVKAFVGSFNSSDDFQISIPDCKIIRDTKSIPNNIKQEIIEFCIKNSFELEQYWKYGKDYSSEDFNDMLIRMKLDKSEIIKSKTIKLSSVLKL